MNLQSIVCRKKTFSQALAYVGKLHNDYQDTLLNYLLINNINLQDTNSLKNIIAVKSKAFFQSKGISDSGYVLNLSFKPSPISWSLNGKNYSVKGKSILTSLQSTVQKYASNTINSYDFAKALDGLLKSALQLPDSKEVFAVGIPVIVASSSMSYWKANGDRWITGLSRVNKPCRIGWGSLGGADITGAIGGAMGGSAFGPGGALAFGVLESAISSLYGLTSQVMSCKFSWW
ncbi:hypothetical protein ACQ33O_01170 [Ferruginibacter sp. SUN002]|uniref:hypothetical protein n=1 Tax=Ferruginibacter sp. SUN002 TaxID=2937789 RepID=UPI003D35E788